MNSSARSCWHSTSSVQGVNSRLGQAATQQRLYGILIPYKTSDLVCCGRVREHQFIAGGTGPARSDPGRRGVRESAGLRGACRAGRDGRTGRAGAGERAACGHQASTGTGKSLAYLLPIVRSGKVAIISTANKNLQEQLFYKDIPFVQRHVKYFRAALIKGMGNYLCLDRFERENSELLPFQRSGAFDRLLQFLQEDATGPADGLRFDGDLDLTPFAIPGDLRARIAADSDQCAWSKCNWFGDCYVREMRQRAREAQVIVVNHTLLLLDAAMEGWLLPERDVVVIDEAHHLEEEATRAFTAAVSPGRVQSLLQQRRLRDN